MCYLGCARTRTQNANNPRKLQGTNDVVERVHDAAKAIEDHETADHHHDPVAHSVPSS